MMDGGGLMHTLAFFLLSGITLAAAMAWCSNATWCKAHFCCQ